LLKGETKNQDSFAGFFSSRRLKIAVASESMILNSSADPKSSMVKPVTTLLAMSTTIALTMNRKRPKVKMVAGKVKRIRRGFTKIFRKASTSENHTAVENLSTWIPKLRFDNVKETTATQRRRRRNFIINGD
jgi:hypothetical protein